VAAGRFRQDLYFRLNVFAIRLPPLRQRKSDIPLLVQHFLEAGKAAGLPEFCPSPEVMEAFHAYDWPGNVRELKRCIDRMSALHSEGLCNCQTCPRRSSTIGPRTAWDAWQAPSMGNHPYPK
jgi:DNA-binding NtrC family response regulator